MSAEDFVREVIRGLQADKELLVDALAGKEPGSYSSGELVVPANRAAIWLNIFAHEQQAIGEKKAIDRLSN